jgi:hypothetical protein
VSELEHRRAVAERLPPGFGARWREKSVLPRALEYRHVQPYDLLDPVAAPPQASMWLRAVAPLPEDFSLHCAMLAYASDHGLLLTAMRPHGLALLRGDVRLASLDHAMWFHRDLRIDDWLLHDMDSPSAFAGGRGQPPGHRCRLPGAQSRRQRSRCCRGGANGAHPGRTAVQRHWRRSLPDACQRVVVEAYDGRETAPAAATENLFIKADGKPMAFMEAVVGGKSVGVPGTVRMLELAHKEHGKLPWASCSNPPSRWRRTVFWSARACNTLLAGEKELIKDPVAAPISTMRRQALARRTCAEKSGAGASAAWPGRSRIESVE